MRADVPQFIDVEDKIAGPLTWKQLLWMIALLVLLIIFYNVFESGAFILIAIPLTLTFVALAFVKPYGQPLTRIIYYGVFHLFGPKIYVWRREIQSAPSHPQEKTGSQKNKDETSSFTLGEIESLAKTLDKK